MIPKTIVIGVSAVSGGGKTRLVNELAGLLDDAMTVYFDDTTEHPPDMRAWLSENGDYNVWRAPGLAKRLQQLKEGVAVGSTGKPARYVVFDAPLGRAHTETGKYIDHMVFIDTPLDVALARRMLRDGHDVWNGDHLRRYLDWARGLFIHHIEKVSASADVVLDGTLPVDTGREPGGAQVVPRFPAVDCGALGISGVELAAVRIQARERLGSSLPQGAPG